MRKIAEWKKKQVENIKDLAKKFANFGIVDMRNLPALQLQRMKNQLKGSMVILMVKKRLLKIALAQLKDEKENVGEMIEKVSGMPALIFSDDSPFKIQKILNKNKSSALAKAGQIAPNDLVIKAGPTSFPPGPIIGELGQLKIKTEVKEGKVAIKVDVVVVKEGEEIKPKVADVLTKLGIEPMEVGLSLVLAYEQGVIYDKKSLSVDEETCLNDLRKAHLNGLNLALAVGYVTKETVSLLIHKVCREANALSQFEPKTDVVKVEEKLLEIKEEPKSEEKPAEVKEEPKSEEKPVEIKQAKVVEVKEPVVEKKTNVPKFEKPPSSEEILKEVEKDFEVEKKKLEEENKEKREMEEVEKLTKEIMWGENDRKK